MPFWMHFLGYQFLSGSNTDETLAVRVPYWNIVRTLVLTLAPLLIGVLIAKYLPEYANRARRALRPFVAFLLVFLIVFGTLANLHIFDIITWTAALAGFLLPLCGFAFGCVAAALACRKSEDIVTIAIETGVQHTGIAIMLLELSFPEPDSQIAMLLPVIVACSTPGPLLIGCGMHRLCRFVRKRRRPSTEADERTSHGEAIELRIRSPRRSASKKRDGHPLSTLSTDHGLPPPNELARLSEEDLTNVLVV